jgi:hydroxymethylglutaryl-CoA synthase
MNGIVSYGVYLPYWRLQRSAIGGVLGAGGGRGSRSVASFDEDTTSLGVEAARIALRNAPQGARPGIVTFSTTAPAYLDKTNATAVHAALGLEPSIPAFDVAGASRSGVAALWLAQVVGGLGVVSDIRTGQPGGADEASGGDAAAAFLYGEDGAIAVPFGGASATGEFLDRWRVPGESYSKQWEERFGEHAYLPLLEQAVTDALKGGGVSAADLDHVVVAGLHARAVKAAAKTIGAKPDAYADDLTSEIGNPGVAQAGVILADVLDRAEPDQTILVVSMADGCDAWLLRTTAAIAERRPRPSVRAQLETTRTDLSYASFLTWRGFLRREPPRRPEPDRVSAPPSFRRNDWKYGFYGTKDEAGFVHLPPARVSMESGALDQMTPVRMADVPATIATYTVDRLAYSLSPPVVAAVIDFDGGGRFQCELTDVDPAAVKIGDRVEMTFRRLFTQDGIHNYFWKARPVRGGS